MRGIVQAAGGGTRKEGEVKGDIERRLARLEEVVFPQGATERIMQSFQRWYDEMVSEDIRQEKEDPKECP